MIVIKRYPNRKLYDTVAKQYVSLDVVAELIRQGADVQVVDHATGDDVTNLVLVQIIAEQERKKAGFLPLPVLTGLIQAGGETLASLRRGLATPLDMLRQVDEEIESRLEHLISNGELGEEEGQRLRDKLLARGRWALEAMRPSDGALERFVGRRGLPTRTDFQALSDQLDILVREVEGLSLSLRAQGEGPGEPAGVNGPSEPGHKLDV